MKANYFPFVDLRKTSLSKFGRGKKVLTLEISTCHWIEQGLLRVDAERWCKVVEVGPVVEFEKSAVKIKGAEGQRKKGDRYLYVRWPMIGFVRMVSIVWW